MDVWADERALYIWADGKTADLAPVKAAKAALGYGFTVKPFAVTPDSPPPAGHRVLAIGSRPNWITDYALTSENTSPEGWQRALAWVLGEVEHDPRATLVLDILSSILPPNARGEMVRELTETEIEAERKLRAYNSGEN